jgi:uncharacterized spore protein YtfJ
MEQITNLFEAVTASMARLAKTEHVVGKPIVHGQNVVIPLIEISVGFGAGGGSGEAKGRKAPAPSGNGLLQASGAGGGLAISPVGLLILEGENVRIEGIHD